MTSTKIEIQGNTPMVIFKPPILGSILLPEGVIVRCRQCNSPCNEYGQNVLKILPMLLGRKNWKAVMMMVDCRTCGTMHGGVLDFECDHSKKDFLLPFPILLPRESEIRCRNCTNRATGSQFVLKEKAGIIVLALQCSHCKAFTQPFIYWLL